MKTLKAFLVNLKFSLRVEDFRHQRMMVVVTGWGMRRYEVWQWPPDMGINEAGAWIAKLKDPRARYHRLQLSAERRLRTSNYSTAQLATMIGVP